VRGQVQREGEVIHVVAQRLEDLSPLLASVGNRGDVADIYRVSRADVVKSPVGPDPRDPAQSPLAAAPATSIFRTCGLPRASSPVSPQKAETFAKPVGPPRHQLLGARRGRYGAGTCRDPHEGRARAEFRTVRRRSDIFSRKPR